MEMATLRAAQEARACAKTAKHTSICRDIAWQIVMLAERAAGHRATAGANVPALEYRKWMAMFESGDPALGDPVPRPEDDAAAAAGREAASDRERQLANAIVTDYLECVGEWARPEEKGGAIGTNAPIGVVRIRGQSWTAGGSGQ